MGILALEGCSLILGARNRCQGVLQGRFTYGVSIFFGALDARLSTSCRSARTGGLPCFCHTGMTSATSCRSNQANIAESNFLTFGPGTSWTLLRRAMVSKSSRNSAARRSARGLFKLVVLFCSAVVRQTLLCVLLLLDRRILPPAIVGE